MENVFQNPRTNYAKAIGLVSSTTTLHPPPALNKVVITLKLPFYEHTLLWNTETIKGKTAPYECFSIKSFISNFDIFLVIIVDIE